MNDNDPFSSFEADRTVIKPSAGRAGRPVVAPVQSVVQDTPLFDKSSLPDLPPGVGLSPLLQLGSSLLVAGTRIRAMPQHGNPKALRDALVEAVRKFEAAARSQGLPNEQVVAGRYLLCTYVDECASSTPWGGAGAWSSQSLLVLFHNESWGGEKLFQLLGKLTENVAGNRGLLELICAILALGFEGRYRVLDNGRAQLEAVREKLSLMLREQSGSALPELSPKWAGASEKGRRLSDGIPVWIVATIAALFLGLIFFALRLAVVVPTDEVFSKLQALDVKPSQLLPPPAPPVPAAKPRLSGFLRPEIESGAVAVRDLEDRSIIIIRGDGFFNPGSAEVSAKVLPLLSRIGEELGRMPGKVSIFGHTDNQPIRSIRYPSNWHLSQERATAVMTILGSQVKPDRMRAEGLADTQPVGDNATPAGRAMNRRVEITLMVSGAG